MRTLHKTLQSLGYTVAEQQGLYLQANYTFGRGQGVLEFLFADDDNIVQLRGVPAIQNVVGKRALEVQFDKIRRQLRWPEVPILRNRQRLLGVIESPFDQLGDAPPLEGSMSDAASPGPDTD